ncbi:hypothetical protein B0H13DRAFT_2340741 [Mycena leptocephala]|nr:hypothetical protein B0H13DRAFT_2340741 [Mycena leptocephala]
MTYLIQLPQLLLSTHRPQHLSSSDLPHKTSPSDYIRTVSTFVSPFASRSSTRSPAIFVLVTQSTRYCPLSHHPSHPSHTSAKQGTNACRPSSQDPYPTTAERDRYRTPNGGASLLPVLPSAITWRCAPPAIGVDGTPPPLDAISISDPTAALRTVDLNRASTDIILACPDIGAGFPPSSSILHALFLSPLRLFLDLTSSAPKRARLSIGNGGFTASPGFVAPRIPLSCRCFTSTRRPFLPSALLPDLCLPTIVLGPCVFSSAHLCLFSSLPRSALNAWMLFWFHTRCLLRGFAVVGSPLNLV